MNNLKLSVVIPAYNESVNIQRGSLDEVEGYLTKQKYNFEVLIVDDGSTDDTVSLIDRKIKNKKDFKLIKNSHGGKAIAVMSGLLMAKGKVVLFTDMDQATPLQEVEKFWEKFAEGFDIVIGSRQGRKGAPLVRKIAAYCFASIRNIVLGLPYIDTQCGFKAFTNQAIQEIFPTLSIHWKKVKESGAAVNAGFDVEVLFLAKKKNLKIAEVVVDWHHVGTERVQIIKDSIEAIKDILRIRLNDWQKKY
ncbi:glycosyltransferase [Candidatus Daviesbacteria bacterium]|nr:glycosyltransferase [Candidatus Daviesbacteria bacterium]